MEATTLPLTSKKQYTSTGHDSLEKRLSQSADSGSRHVPYHTTLTDCAAYTVCTYVGPARTECRSTTFDQLVDNAHFVALRVRVPLPSDVVWEN